MCRDPDTCTIRDRSAQSFFSINATWSSGSKSNFGGSPSSRTTVLKVSSGPTGAPSQGMLGMRISSDFSSVFLFAELGFQLARLGARFLRPPPKLRLSSGAALLKPALIALRSARSASISVFSARTSPSSASSSSRSTVDPLAAIALSTAARSALMKSSPSMAAACANCAVTASSPKRRSCPQD